MSRSAGTQDVHHWSRLRMPALRLGLLEGAEEVRLREHLASCASCQESYAAIIAERPSGEPPGEHIPADLIARWPQTTASLRGIERAAVRSHLEHCAECRQDLELLGHQPALERIVGLEPEAEVGASVSSEVQPPETPAVKTPFAGEMAERPTRTVRVLVRPPDVWSRAARWVIGGWALAATAAALVLVFRPPVMPRGADLTPALPAPSGEGGWSSHPVATGTASTGVASPARAGTQLLPAIVPQLSFATRDGGGESVVTTRVPPGARVLVLPAATEALAGMKATERVLVELVAPSGKLLLSEGLTLGRMREERVLVYELGADPIESGVYRLKFRAGDEEVEARFRLETRTGGK